MFCLLLLDAAGIGGKDDADAAEVDASEGGSRLGVGNDSV